MDKFELGNTKQIGISILFCVIAIIATKSPHVANIHLAITILLGILHVYVAGKWADGKIKSNNDAPPSIAYLIAFGLNGVISIAYSWWFSGIVWLLILCIYIAVQTPKKVKAEGETAK